MTTEEVIKGLTTMAEYWEYRYKKDRNDMKGTDLYYMNTAAEAAVLLGKLKDEEDDGK